MRKTTIELLIVGFLGCLLALLAVREHFGYQIDPLIMIALFFAGTLVLIALVRHPAAFIIPVLFIPRLQSISIFNRFEITKGITWLALAIILLSVAISLRFINMGLQESAPVASTPNYGNVLFAFLLFGIVLAVSYLYTPAPQYGADKLFRFWTLGGLLFITPFFLMRSAEDFRDFAVGTVGFAMVVAASSLKFSASGAMGAHDDPAHIGKAQVTGMAMLLLLYYPITNKRLRKIVLLICVPWLAVGLVSAEARGPLFSALLVLVLGLVFPSLRSRLVSRKQMFLGAFVLFAAIFILSRFWFYGEEATRFRSKTDELFQIFSNSTEARGTAVERLVFYRAAFHGWLQHPLLGWGIGGWSMYYYSEDNRVYPHNLVLEVLVEEGLLGFVALTYLLTSVSQILRKTLDEVEEYYPYLLPLWIYLISITMFSGDIDDNRFVWFWCAAVLAGCSLVRRSVALEKLLPDVKQGRIFKPAHPIFQGRQ